MEEGSTLNRPGSSSDLQKTAKELSPTLNPKSGSPLLILFQEEGGCLLYNPDEARVYSTNTDLSGYRFLGNSGKWFLAIDSQSELYIIDVLSGERILLPPLESIIGEYYRLERVGAMEFKETLLKVRWAANRLPPIISAEELNGVLWVDDKTGDYVVVWRFGRREYLGFCKKGDDHYREIQLRFEVRIQLRGVSDMVLKGYTLYILTTRDFIRVLDLSGGECGFRDVSEGPFYPMQVPSDAVDSRCISECVNLAVTTSGEILMVYNTAFPWGRSFSLYRRDPNLDPHRDDLVEVTSLGDEALLMDLGITVPARGGVEPNSIYFTRDDRVCLKKSLFRRDTSWFSHDICVFNLATKTLRLFTGLWPGLSNLKLKDAQWFLP